MYKQPGVYILQSLKNNRYYVGSTENIDKRFQEHQTGKVKATRNLRPWKLKIFYSTTTITEARKLEHKVKRFKSRKIIEQIVGDGQILTKIVAWGS